MKAYRADQAYDKAVALLMRLAEQDPARQREAYNQIAEIKTEAHQDAEAIAWSQKALEKSPNDPAAYERLAERYKEMQRLDDAVAAYQKTIELAPRNWKAYFALAELHQQRIERARRREPQHHQTGPTPDPSPQKRHSRLLPLGRVVPAAGGA